MGECQNFDSEKTCLRFVCRISPPPKLLTTKNSKKGEVYTPEYTVLSEQFSLRRQSMMGTNGRFKLQLQVVSDAVEGSDLVGGDVSTVAADCTSHAAIRVLTGVQALARRATEAVTTGQRSRVNQKVTANGTVERFGGSVLHFHRRKVLDWEKSSSYKMRSIMTKSKRSDSPTEREQFQQNDLENLRRQCFPVWPNVQPKVARMKFKYEEL